MYSETTHSITITVDPMYLADESDPDEDRFFWAYRVKIENHGDQSVQLLRRHWHITDSNGFVQEVRGAGVVGETPVLEPGETFEYTSGTPLTTPSGIMVGTYQMVNKSGERFDVAIPAFSLDSPYQDRQLN